MKKIWFVARADNKGGPGFTRHETRKTADLQAKQLAVKNPGVRYVVYEAVAFTEMPVPVVEIIEVR